MMSTSSMRRMFPSTLTRRTTEMPMGLGRLGARMAKMPCGWSSINGLTKRDGLLAR